MRTVYVKDVPQCLVSKNVYEAIENEKEDGANTIQGLVPKKYKTQLGDAQVDLESVDNAAHTQPNTLLLKDPGLNCFLLRCNRDEAEPFMEWVVETVLPREVRKLASTIEGKNAVIVLVNDDLQGRDDQIQAIKYENVALQGQRDVYQVELQKCQDIITHLKTRHVPHARDPGKDNIIIIVRKHTTSTRPVISFMASHIISREFNGVKGMLN